VPHNDFRIGEWSVHPRVNAIESGGKTKRLEPKVMQVLVTLASSAGDVITREQLRSVVWPDVIVGEDVIIRAISELRHAFSDDPRSPHFIETIPKVGYRVIAPVVQPEHVSTNGGPLKDQHQADLGSPAATAAISTPPVTVPAPPRGRRAILAPVVGASLFAATTLLLVAAVGMWWHSKRNFSAPVSFVSRPLTTYPGSQLQPAFSPDGTAIAFVWKKEGEESGHIYVKQLGSEDAASLTSGNSDEFSPAWSPDGRTIAFVRHNSLRSTIVTIPAIGGSERLVYVFPVNSVYDSGSLAWTPNGDLIFPQKFSPEGPSVLTELNLQTHEVRTVTNPPQGWDGDFTPQVSPDGKTLAFVRGSQSLTRDVYVMDLPSGAQRRLTFDSRLIVGMAWAADSSAIVFSSNRSGSVSLWRISANGGTPEREPFGTDGAYGPSISKQGGKLVYSHGNAIWTILALDLNAGNAEREAAILTSSEQDSSPHVAPNDAMLAFQSWRSGSQEIWTAHIDGSDPVQITSSGYSAGSPCWSPDSGLIAFDARPSLYSHIFLTDTVGRPIRQLTSGNFNDIIPSWSIDGHWIYFGSTRSGKWQIWKTPSDGSGTAQQVTAGGGMVALESEDGRWLYFTRESEPGLWRMPLAGGPEHKIFDGPPVGYQNYWTFSGNIPYSLVERNGHYSIERVDPETRTSRSIHVMKEDPTPLAGMSVSPDGKRLIFAELTSAASGLTLVERFQ
jgi:Tol biopolymer transport system component/DNA-binding winged helix-turn-helix (wHTH) protein